MDAQVNENEGSFLDAASDAEALNQPTTALDEVMRYVNRLDELNEEIERQNEVLARLTSEANTIAESYLPELFLNNRLTEVKLDNGRVVTVKEDVRVSIPKDMLRQDAAYRWLTANGGGALIKDTLTVADPSETWIAELTAQGVEYERARAVNGNSLAAFFREFLGLKKGCVARGRQDDVSADINLFIQRKAVIK